MTFDAVRKIAHALPDVEDGMSYGTPALKIKGKLFVRFRPDIDAIVVKMPFAKRDELLQADPDVYFLTRPLRCIRVYARSPGRGQDGRIACRSEDRLGSNTGRRRPAGPWLGRLPRVFSG